MAPMPQLRGFIINLTSFASQISPPRNPLRTGPGGTDGVSGTQDVKKLVP